MKRTLALTSTLVVALALTACGSSDSGEAATTSPTPSASKAGLAGTSWNLATYAGSNGTRTPVPDGVTATADFSAKTISGSGGCNTFSGPYKIKGTSLTVGPIASTLRACSGAAGSTEAAYFKLLDQVTGYAIDRKTLIMIGPKDAVLLTFNEATATPLVGTTWTATGINNGKNAVQSTATGTTVTAVFDQDGTVSGDGGCNTYNGPYTSSGKNLSFGALSTTKEACEAAVSDQEAAYLAALARVSTFTIRGDVLELRDSKGALQATYTS